MTRSRAAGVSNWRRRPSLRGTRMAWKAWRSAFAQVLREFDGQFVQVGSLRSVAQPNGQIVVAQQQLIDDGGDLISGR